jgi:hypothetical protein
VTDTDKSWVLPFFYGSFGSFGTPSVENYKLSIIPTGHLRVIRVTHR